MNQPGVPASFDYHARLNSPEVIPGGWYRRNVSQYEILSYINHIIALQIAGNWDTAPLFVRRAAKFLAKPVAEHLTPEYRALAIEFLRAAATDLRREDVGKFGLEFLDEAVGILDQLPTD